MVGYRVVAVLVMSVLLQATPTISISTIGSGGGTSTGTPYTVSGTIGEFDATQSNMTGGGYTVRGGFWHQLPVNSVPPNPYDIDGNGFITPEDAIYVINRIGQTKNSGNALADVDNDGDIDQADADAIISRIGTTP
ncbi:MAG: dockerin type I domain-containing protein [Chloroflexota bacterium]